MGVNIGNLFQDAVGVLGGGKSQVGAIALSAKAGQVANQARSDIRRRLVQFGAKLGPRMGSEFFDALSQGAQGTANMAYADEQRRLFGYSTSDLKWLLIGGVSIIVAGVFAWKKL